MKHVIPACLLLLAALAASLNAFAADTYPTRPIKLIVAFRAGGQSDLNARKIAEICEQYKLLPQPVVVVTMPGANTRNALRFVQNAAPDGYTLLLFHSSLVAMHASGQLPMSFRDFDMVAQVLRTPMASFLSLPDAPWKNWKEMVEYAKANKREISVAIGGLGGTTHTMFAYLTNATGTGHLFNPVFFSGLTECKTALMGKKVDVLGDAPVGAIGIVESGMGKMLLITDRERRPEFPDTNNFDDFGLTNVVYMRNGIYAPKGTPGPILATLQSVMEKVVATPEYKEFAKLQKCDAEFLTGAEYYAQFEKDEKVFADLSDILKRSIDEKNRAGAK
ncbi:MAG: tripartite tricarboxylate transporter substrate binding protein [Desulfovibrio sp.]|nr:tripartite tricarboxylate transporter substrate binding protein [Desulfovibrio sp.]